MFPKKNCQSPDHAKDYFKLEGQSNRIAAIAVL